MRNTYLFVLMVVIGSPWLVSSYATTFPKSAAAATARITILYDAFGKEATMTKDWGYAALVEINGKRILFDTGDDAAILSKNVKARRVDLTRLDFVVLSHRHSDHMGGISYLLGVNPKVKIYAPKEGFGIFGSDLPSKFYRKDETLPIAGGFHLVVAQDEAIAKVATALHDTYKVDYIAPGHCTGEPAFAALQRTFGDHYLYAGLGTTLDLGANPRAASDRRATGVLDEGDLRNYRALLTLSDDLRNGGPEIVHLFATRGSCLCPQPAQQRGCCTGDNRPQSYGWVERAVDARPTAYASRTRFDFGRCGCDSVGSFGQVGHV
jgi:hypothetical protein